MTDNNIEFLSSQERKSSFVLPPHKDHMTLAIVCTLFCCIVSGIIAIVNASKANSLYNAAVFAADDNLKAALYAQSEEKSKAARNWNIVSIVGGGIWMLLCIGLIVAGVLAELMVA
ncbi:MAG: CD225/dispanin family protein [Bacteroidales bacterium]|nr:CD225/dispanin family protein [Bacteroidales bacterium]MDE6147583.1 CD225/dispanin family protein [Bacteroidales bacterium]